MVPPACKQLPCRDPPLGAQVVCGANPQTHASDSCYPHSPHPLMRNIAVNLADDPTLYGTSGCRPGYHAASMCAVAVDTSLAPLLTPVSASASALEMPVLAIAVPLSWQPIAGSLCATIWMTYTIGRI
ncbi:hypothetical protein B0H14DRAFT_3498692 [Mycena olivaceomarginata]|nr:hypothetical protein B0H14DRAFT_3498692 [Mycena olivaceomarginata]